MPAAEWTYRQPPAGFVYTREHRSPRPGEFYSYQGRAYLSHSDFDFPAYPILRLAHPTDACYAGALLPAAIG